MGPLMAYAQKDSHTQYQGVFDMTEQIINGIIGVAGASIVGLLAIIAKWLWNIRDVMTTVKHSDMRRSDQMRTLFNVQVLQINALKTIIEVVGKGDSNGNVDKALGDMNRANEALQDHASNNAWC